MVCDVGCDFTEFEEFGDGKNSLIRHLVDLVSDCHSFLGMTLLSSAMTVASILSSLVIHKLY